MKSMTKLFIALCIGLATCFALFIDDFIEHRIEEKGSLYLKAKLEIDEVDIQLFPLELTLYKVRATNMFNPNRNIITIPKLAIQADAKAAWDYVNSKPLIINTVHASDLKFDQPRKRSGAIPGVTPKLNASTSSDLDIDSTTSPIQIDTTEQQAISDIDAHKAHAAKIQKYWQSVSASDQALTLEKYKKRWDSLQTQDTTKKLSGLRQLKTDLSSELSNTELTQKQLQNDLTTLTNIKSELEKISGYSATTNELQRESVERIAQQLAEKLITQRFNLWVNDLMMFYQHFSQTHTNIPFTLSNIAFNGDIKIGNDVIPINGWVKNLTTSIADSNAPISFLISGQEDKKTVLTISGEYISSTNNHIDLTANDFDISAFVLANTTEARTMLGQATANATGKLSIVDNQLSLNFDVLFKNAQIAVETNVSGASNNSGSDDLLITLVSDNLRNIDRFDIQISANGNITQPLFNVTSSLDQIFLNSAYLFQQSRFDPTKQQLSASLNDARNMALSETIATQQHLEAINSQINTQIQSLENLMLML